MKNSLDIELYLSSGEANSQLKTKVYEEELKAINARFPLEVNQIDIKQIYLVKKNTVLETECFIRNGLNNNIALEEVVFIVQDSMGNIVASKRVNFKNYGAIPPFSASPYSINFELNEDASFSDNEEYVINFSNADELKAFPSVATEIENMPIDITFEEEKAIRNFVNGLQTLKTGEYSISVYRIMYNNSKGIDCTLILQNGTDKVIDIGILPISLMDENKHLIVRKEFKNENNSLVVNSKKSKIINIEFGANELPAEKIDISKCSIEIN